MNQILGIMTAALISFSSMETDLKIMILFGFVVIAELGWLVNKSR